MHITILKNLFAGFLHARRMTRHFGRRDMLDSVVRTGVGRDAPDALSRTLAAAALDDRSALLDRLGSHIDGLTEQQAEAIRERVGFNEVGREKPLPWWRHLWHCYRNPFNLLLTLLAAISGWTEDMEAVVVIGTMVALSTLLRFWQEVRSNRAADALKAALPFAKLNVAAIGNVVSQLHIHVIGRSPGDAAWPDPVWTYRPRQPRTEGESARIAGLLRRSIGSAA